MKTKVRLARWLFHALADDEWMDGGAKTSPPGSAQRLEFGELDGDKLNPAGMRPMYIADTGPNDGSELWLGTHDKWYVFYRAEDARRLAWFILWTWWAKSTWFGLKRRLWYWALHTDLRSQPWYREWRATREFWQEKTDEAAK